ncbi:Predicted RNA-binding protein, contains TRAM domain [Halogranum rubrum]|uniref:Predicted RNA-binding protein, contains TRAM domain n=1 Tax=Halogranum rubrum TaxID=553466 RepID=A0A1I4HUW1_9EURY|nr:TRAM domain-containing protein [Halogranum rubrum]SFL45567.1 Predicted RNA-binding protein, contains TRAM domain [Halogranum rubrum]
MVKVPDSLRCLFSASVTEHEGSYRIEVPRGEIEESKFDVGEDYGVGVLTHTAASSPSDSPDAAPNTSPDAQQGPPVEEGDVREVMIETLGEQGDGIAKVERGYVVIVDGGQPGETIEIEVHTVRETVTFAEIVGSEP